jgi:hypothetical protein
MKKTFSDMRGSSASSSFPKNGLVELDAAADVASIAAVLIAKRLDASLILFGSTFHSPLRHLTDHTDGTPQNHPEPYSAKYEARPSLIFHGGGALWGAFKRPRRREMASVQSRNVRKSGTL